MHDEVIDIQARKDIAVVESKLDAINTTLQHILTAIIVAMAGATGASVWSFVFAHKV